MQYKQLGLFIKKKREKHNITLNSFAINNDIEPATLSRIENLKQGIKLDVLIKISRGFNQTPANFLADFEKSK